MLRNVLCEELPQTRHHYGVLFNRTRLSLICLLFFLSGATKFLSMMVAWAVQYTMCYCRHKRIKRQNTHTKYVNSSICVRLGLSPFCVNYHLPPYSTAIVVVRIIIACLNVWIFSYISWDIKQCVPFGRRSNANSGFWFCSRLWFPELCFFIFFVLSKWNFCYFVPNGDIPYAQKTKQNPLTLRSSPVTMYDTGTACRSGFIAYYVVKQRHSVKYCINVIAGFLFLVLFRVCFLSANRFVSFCLSLLCACWFLDSKRGEREGNNKICGYQSTSSSCTNVDIDDQMCLNWFHAHAIHKLTQMLNFLHLISFIRYFCLRFCVCVCVAALVWCDGVHWLILFYFAGCECAIWNLECCASCICEIVWAMNEYGQPASILDADQMNVPSNHMITESIA